MPTDLLLPITGAVVAALVLCRLSGWMGQTADLRLSLFRPYRGDPWPHGVQEEDGVRWRWNATTAAPEPDDPDVAPIDVPVIVDGPAAPVARLQAVHGGRVAHP